MLKPKTWRFQDTERPALRVRGTIVALVTITLVSVVSCPQMAAANGRLLDRAVGYVASVWVVAIIVMLALMILAAWSVLFTKYGTWKPPNFLIASAVLAVASIALTLSWLHIAALTIWTATPAGFPYADLYREYDRLCQIKVQDDEYNSGHVEIDWHSGDQVCEPRLRRLRALYPGPTWLFGDPPKGPI